MSDDVVISIEEIRTAIDRLLTAVERDYGSVLRFQNEQYWTLPVVASFDLHSIPTATVGQLGDDAGAVRELSAVLRR